jgi:hyperosmotically inducible periplasmic protein
MPRFVSILLFFTALIINAGHAHADLKGIEQTWSDSMITTKITAKFTQDRDLNPLKISVSTQHGTVSLTGHVKDNAAFVKALRIAKNTQGVKSVETEELIIKPVNTAITDTYITAKVETAILKAKVFDDESIPLVGISAETSNGTVTLRGKVKNNQSILAIVKWTNKVRGVKKIISNLEVSDATL